MEYQLWRDIFDKKETCINNKNGNIPVIED